MDQVHLRAIEAEERRTRRSYRLTIASLLWRSTAETAFQALQLHGEARIFLLRFETLLEQPEATIGSLAQCKAPPKAVW